MSETGRRAMPGLNRAPGNIRMPARRWSRIAQGLFGALVVAIIALLGPNAARAGDAIAQPNPALTAGTGAGSAPPGAADAANVFKKPDWLSDLSVGIRGSYDDNVFLSGAGSQYLPKVYLVPPGSVVALKDISSWVTTISPKIAVNLAPVLGGQNLEALTLCYAPDFAFYTGAPSEDFQAQRFGTTLKAHAGAFSCNLENSFVYIDGNDVAPTYPGALYSAIGIAAPRERREQIQDRTALALRYDGEQWFFRPTASLLYYDMMTELFNVTGYQNYCDRYDVNGGADLGWKVAPQTAVTLGYRYGYQYQQQFSFTPYSSPNHYQRVLVGIEGNPCKWLELKLVAGPDFRVYPGDSAGHITPVEDNTPVEYYGEASATAKVTAKDTLTLRSKQWQWVSSLGKVPYFDSLAELGYRRAVTSHLSADLGFRWWAADYNSGNLPACRRDDWQYTLLAGVTYNFNTHLSANVAYALNLGRNMENDIANPQAREYNQNLISLGMQLKF